MPMPSAHIQEAIMAGVAPKAWAAWNTMATELVKPTSTATKPATKAERLRSLKNRMRRIVPAGRKLRPRGAMPVRSRSSIRARRRRCWAG
ncbi:hypothetical protein D3C84_1099140 [compost metagenome]